MPFRVLCLGSLRCGLLNVTWEVGPTVFLQFWIFKWVYRVAVFCIRDFETHFSLKLWIEFDCFDNSIKFTAKYGFGWLKAGGGDGGECYHSLRGWWDHNGGVTFWGQSCEEKVVIFLTTPPPKYKTTGTRVTWDQALLSFRLVNKM